MPHAINFNHATAARWGTTTLDRIYSGLTLVWFGGWASAVGLPYTVNFGVASEWAAWLPDSFWSSTTIGGQGGVVSSTGGQAPYHPIIAANIQLSARVTASGAGAYVGLWARVNFTGITYYAAEYADRPGVPSSQLRIVKVLNGVRTILGAWDISRAVTAQVVFKVIGPTLTITRGADSYTVTDTAITAPGGIGIFATQHQGFNTLTATAT